ncbi:MAG: hypothetical protein D6820_13120 [Lentisphaerae bacterium]|nr:MAG: hypothetical protein D6820_13120 [Lentisphaerota bacterium]
MAVFANSLIIWFLALMSIPAFLWQPLVAAELHPEFIHASAKWFLHLNIDQLRKTQLWQEVLTRVTKSPEAAKLKAVQTLFGVDLTRDLADVTFYGADPGGPLGNAITIIHAQFDAERLKAFLALGDQYAEKRYGNFVFYRMSPDQKLPGQHKSSPTPEQFHQPHKKTGAWCTFFRNQYILIAQHPEALQNAVDVLTMKQAHIPKYSPLVSGLQSQGTKQTILQLGILLAEMNVSPPQTAFLKQAQRIQLKIDQIQDTFAQSTTPESFFAAHLLIVTPDDTTTDRIYRSLDGIRAMIQLKLGPDPEFTLLCDQLQKIDLIREKNKVIVSGKFPEPMIIDLLLKKLKQSRRHNNPSSKQPAVSPPGP